MRVTPHVLTIAAFAIGCATTPKSACEPAAGRPCESAGGAGAREAKLLANAEKLTSERKYQSAYVLLSDADPESKSPELVLKKVEIATAYYVTSINHDVFALRDLLPGEDLEALRNGPVEAKLYPLEVRNVLEPLIARHPTDSRLSLALGKYLRERHRNFPELEPSATEYLRLLETAYEHGAAKPEAFEYLADDYTAEGDLDGALRCFESESAKLPGNPVPHYNAALVLLKKNEFQKALPHAQQALAGFASPAYRGDERERRIFEAARMLGRLHVTAGEPEPALAAFKAANAAVPGDAQTLWYQLNAELALKRYADALATAIAVFDIDPLDLGHIHGIMEAYRENDAVPALFEFFEHAIAKHQGEWEPVGVLQFQAGDAYLRFGDYEKARASYRAALKSLHKVYPKNHEAFPIIERRLRDLPAGRKR